MKNATALLILFVSLIFIACTTDETIDRIELEQQKDPVTSVPDGEVDDPEDTPDEENPDEQEEQEEPDVTEAVTCYFQDIEFVSGSTTKIDCLLDLEGQEVTVPANVTLEFDGGDIFNGTMNFSGGNIDPRLLNSKLSIKGNVSMIGNEFDFFADRWGIIEGNVSSEVAENNKLIINELLQFLPTIIDGTVDFNIDKFDAYFKVDGVNENGLELATLGIKIPSNYNLNFTNNTYFRVYPNARPKPTLIYIGEGVENITLTNGKFIGDRDQHDYSDGATHEWGHLVRVGGANNITITGAEFTDATGDGIDVHGYGHAFSSDYIDSVQIFITDNTFKRNRRNQISVTGGRDVFIENNEFIDASIHTNNSSGVAPGFAIDIEAVRSSDGIEYEIAEYIYIRNNVEKGSRVGAFTIHTGDFVTIENNTVENFLSYSTTHSSTIIGNTISAVNDQQKNSGVAIFAGRFDRYDLNYNNKIIGNKIYDYGTGIKATNVDVTVANNEVIDCVNGIMLEEIKNSEFYDNKIFSTRSGSIGYGSGAAATFIDNISISQTTSETLVEVVRDPFKFYGINRGEEFENYTINLENNVVNSEGTSTFASSGINFKNNIIKNGGIRLQDAEKIVIADNDITSNTQNALRIDSGCSEVSITGNTLTTIMSCVFENNTDAVNITISNNSCNEI